MPEPGRRKWQCRTCSEIYDQAIGLPEYGIAPGTRFEDLQDDWVCLLCGAPESDFDLVPEQIRAFHLIRICALRHDCVKPI
jgi:rubredoxin